MNNFTNVFGLYIKKKNVLQFLTLSSLYIVMEVANIMYTNFKICFLSHTATKTMKPRSIQSESKWVMACLLLLVAFPETSQRAD